MFWPDDPKPPPRPDDLNPRGRVPESKDNPTPDLNPEDNTPKDPPDCC